MNTSLALLAITAVAGLLVMALVGFDSEITGQGINIAKIPPETLKKIAAAAKKEQQPSKPPAETKTICDCPDYGGYIVTADEHPWLVSLSFYDCKAFKEIWQIKEKMKMKTAHLVQLKDYCELRGWWGE
ncbi:hypothetical protein KY346_05080 [Candidatus Woesearchaeota archaeon]|nr:hypothetical protein [Candidatus Woesearchaeota archaeon]